MWQHGQTWLPRKSVDFMLTAPEGADLLTSELPKQGGRVGREPTDISYTIVRKSPLQASPFTSIPTRAVPYLAFLYCLSHFYSCLQQGLTWILVCWVHEFSILTGSWVPKAHVSQRQAFCICSECGSVPSAQLWAWCFSKHTAQHQQHFTYISN